MKYRPVASAPDRGLMRSISLKGVFPNASFVGCADVRVSSVACHASRVHGEGAFVVISGSRHHGMEFVPDAIRHGAAALIVESPLCNVSLPQCVVKDSRQAYARLASALAGNPSRSLTIGAITGTNGKTSTSWIVRSLVQAQRERCGLMGTIDYYDGNESQPATLTTPDAAELQAWFARMVRNRCRYAVLEASSHALDQCRLEGTKLDAAVITNVTRDHLDYHQTFDDYVFSKSRIVQHLAAEGWLFVNADDPGAVRAGQLSRHPLLKTFGLELPADLQGRVIEESQRGSRFAVTTDGCESIFWTPLIGRHQISNCLAAIAIAREWGIDDQTIQRGLSRLKNIPGRLQRIENNRGLSLFVDYAHTPDALQRSLEHLRRVAGGRLILVFGAGGDRDREKRPMMGQVACQADLSVVTSDNPRSEDPDSILDDILAGMSSAPNPVHREVDRALAIRWAIAAAAPGDTILVAGKGHETTQTLGTTSIHFDDVEVIRESLSRLASAQLSSREVSVGTSSTY